MRYNYVSIIRSHYPKLFGIRKKLQKIKVKRISRFMITEEEIKMCESDCTKKKEIVNSYMERSKIFLRSSIAEMEHLFEHAPCYHSRTDIDDVRTDMLFCRLAYGFIPSEYLCFELENKTPEERKEFVSDTDMNIFGYTVNDISEVQKVLDKSKSAQKFKELYKRDILVIKSKKDKDSFLRFVEKHPVFVKKKVFSSMGKGVEKVDVKLIDGTIEEYFDNLIAKNSVWLLEELVKQKSQMAEFNPSSVNTIRCITLKTDSGVEIPWLFMRCGRDGQFVDNGGSGGILVGVDSKTGILNTDGYNEYNERFCVHPDSKVPFKNFIVPEFDQLKEICETAAHKEKDFGYLSWDLAYTDAGWIVVEVNEVGQFIVPQATMKKGIKEELNLYIKQMKKFI